MVKFKRRPKKIPHKSDLKKSKSAKNEPIDTRPYMVVTKNNLDKIIKDLFPMDVLFDANERTNKIVFHAYNVLKLWYINIFDQNQKNPSKKIPYPELNADLIRHIMDVVSYKLIKVGKPPVENELTKSLKKFYDQHYKPLLTNADLVCRDRLKHILNYEETEMITNVKTNISEHYISHLRFFIRIYFEIDKYIVKTKAAKLSKEEKKDKMEKIYKIFDGFVTDIFNVKDNDYISNKRYHDKINILREWFIPDKKSFGKDSVPYDIKANTLDYLPHMILLNKKLEEINDLNIKNHDPTKSEYPTTYKLFNAFPLRTSIIPKYITLDTAGLISLFVKKYSSYFLVSLPICKEDLWYEYFHTNMKSFRRKGYAFNNMIKTDGVGCSIVMVKADKDGNPVDPPDFDKMREINELNKIQYINQVPITAAMRNKRIVVNDPGKSTPISCMRENDKDQILTSTGNKYKLEGNKKDFFKNIHFEYSQGQRNHDIKKQKYENIRDEFKKQKIGGKTIIEIESELSNYNGKTCIFDRFKEYVAAKIKTNQMLYDHYNQFIYRKFKLNTFINKRRSEDKMMNEFKKKMGSPKEVLLVLGDYSDNGLKGTQPAMTKGIIKIVKRHGYDSYLLDEYNTSKKSSCCMKGEMENFLPRVTEETIEIVEESV